MSFLSGETAFVSTGTDHIFGVTIWKHNFLSLTTERNKQLILSSNFLSVLSNYVVFVLQSCVQVTSTQRSSTMLIFTLS